MYRDWSYEEAKAKAKELKSLGEEEIYLNKPPYPWNLTTKLTSGGSHRLDINTSVWFYGRDDALDLEFRWSFDIEPHSANGKGTYSVEVESCLATMKLLPIHVKKQFQDYLTECANAIEKHAEELSGYAGKEYVTANLLKQASGLTK